MNSVKIGDISTQNNGAETRGACRWCIHERSGR